MSMVTQDDVAAFEDVLAAIDATEEDLRDLERADATERGLAACRRAANCDQHTRARAAQGAGAASVNGDVLGETKPVWHVVGPGSKNRSGVWYCFGTRQQAERFAAGTTRQVSEGVATLSEWEPGGMRFWDVKRPEWRG